MDMCMVMIFTLAVIANHPLASKLAARMPALSARIELTRLI